MRRISIILAAVLLIVMLAGCGTPDDRLDDIYAQRGDFTSLYVLNNGQEIQITGNGQGGSGQGFNWRGAWVSSSNYAAYDVVTNAGSCYVCTKSVANSITVPGSDTADFAILASVGGTGAQGPAGTGTPGPQGVAGQGFSWRGDWVTGQPYAIYDVVTDSGSCYQCIAAISNSTTQPGSDPTHFAVMAEAGGKGLDGISISWQGTFSSAPVSPGVNAAYRNSTDGKTYIWNGNQWYEMNQDGAPGSVGSSGQGFTWRGAWVSGQNYAAYDVTTNAGNCYECILAISNSTIAPVSDTSHFSILASAGNNGSNGTNGQGFNWRGAWVSGNSYAAYDVTTNAGNCYECISAISNSTIAPVTDTSHFSILASAGNNGSNGTNGVSITWLGTFASAPVSPTLNQAYRNSTDGKSYVWNGSSWLEMNQDGTQGAVGNNGTNGQGFNWRGAWASGTAYNAYDVVSWSGSSYDCILATSGTTSPDQDPTHWALIAMAGIRADYTCENPATILGTASSIATIIVIENPATILGTVSSIATTILIENPATIQGNPVAGTNIKTTFALVYN